MEIDEERVFETFRRYAAWPVLAVVFVFMVSVRMMPRSRVFTDRGVVYTGNDPWYHMRMVRLLVESFPATPAWDVWSRFPYGTGRHSGFGGLFDQLIAFASIVVGGGSPSPELVDTVGAVAPVVFGAATILPVYYIVKRIADRWTGLLAAVILGLSGGQFLNRTVVGSPDHQSAEALFGAIAVAGLIAALTAAYRYKPTTAHIADRDIAGLREFAVISAVGGVGIASYLMTWPPGVMIVFTFGIFGGLQAIREHLRGTPTDYTTFGIAAPLLAAAVLTALFAKTTALEATGFSLLQPLVLVVIAAGMLYLNALSTWFDDRDLDPRSYPVTVVGTGLVGLALMAVLYPEGLRMFDRLIRNIYSFGLLSSPSRLTVAEISPASPAQAWRAFGFMFLLAVGALAVLVYRTVMEDRPIELLVLLWSLTMFSAYFTMIRFGYYVAVNVAILSAFLIRWGIVDVMEIDLETTGIRDIKGYEVLTLVILALLILPGNVVAIGGTSSPVWDTAPQLSGANGEWLDELDWVRNNTPEPPLEYTAHHDRPSDRDFDYPVDRSSLEGAYGVLSWWDYGHWITTRGQRIPVANPFQENQYAASDFLTARSEQRADLVLDALPSVRENVSDIHEMSDQELRSAIDDQSDQERYEDTRYVMIDDQSAGGKFNAIATWTEFSGYVTREPFQFNNQTQRLPATNDVYDETMLSRLYFDDADGLAQYRLVHENERYSVLASILNLRQGQVQRVNRRVMQRDHDDPFNPGSDLLVRDLSALPDQQTIPIGQNRQLLYDIKSAASVKTFERVPGATISGDADVSEPTSVTALLELGTTNTDRNFTYTRTVQTDADGDFTVDVSYPTETGLGPSDGATDEAVESLSPYQVYIGNVTVQSLLGQTVVLGNASESGTVEIPERQIYEGGSVTVDLEEVDRQVATDNGSIDLSG